MLLQCLESTEITPHPAPLQTKQFLGSGGALIHLIAKHSQSTHLFPNNYNVFVKAWHLMAEKTAFGHTQLHHLTSYTTYFCIAASASKNAEAFFPTYKPSFPTMENYKLLVSARDFLKDLMKNFILLFCCKTGHDKTEQQFREQDLHSPSPTTGKCSCPAGGSVPAVILNFRKQFVSHTRDDPQEQCTWVIYNSLNQWLLPLTQGSL